MIEGKSMSTRSARWKEQILVLYFGLRHESTPLYAKFPVIFSIVYLVSPIDLIPDFIPFVGYIDDMIIVPLLMSVSLRLLPEQVREDSRLKARRQVRKLDFLMVIVVLILLGLLTATFFLFRYIFHH